MGGLPALGHVCRPPAGTLTRLTGSALNAGLYRPCIKWPRQCNLNSIYLEKKNTASKSILKFICEGTSVKITAALPHRTLASLLPDALCKSASTIILVSQTLK